MAQMFSYIKFGDDSFTEEKTELNCIPFIILIEFPLKQYINSSWVESHPCFKRKGFSVGLNIPVSGNN